MKSSIQREDSGQRDPATHHLVVLGDSRRLKRVADDSVHLVVTSPPYWQLKDYGQRDQIGFHQTYEEYVGALAAVWKECVRTLQPGCRMAINIGDQFARAVTYGRYRVIPIHADIIRSCERLEVDFMGSIIWQKVTTCNTTGGGAVMGSFPFPRNGVTKFDYEHILLFKKPGKAPMVDREVKEAARLTTEEWNQYFYGHWYFPGARQEEHIAIFPDELPRRLIRMFTFPGEVVLDPFLGSGTTTKVARELGRHSVGYETHEEFLPTICKKIGFGRERDLFDGQDTFKVVRESRRRTPRKSAESVTSVESRSGFGSVVRKGDSKQRETYHRVAAVDDIAAFTLESGESYRLVGVRDNGRTKEGMQFLRQLVMGRQVYLRHDDTASEERDSPLVYLHLKNRTCVNSKLIRSGYADAVDSGEYRLRKRYVRYQQERDAT